MANIENNASYFLKSDGSLLYKVQRNTYGKRFLLFE
jgi:hypothetical protein